MNVNLQADGQSAAVALRRSKYAVVGHGSFGGGTLSLEYEVASGVWVPVPGVSLTANTMVLLGPLPAGNYRASLTGSLTPNVNLTVIPTEN